MRSLPPCRHTSHFSFLPTRLLHGSGILTLCMVYGGEGNLGGGEGWAGEGDLHFQP